MNPDGEEACNGVDDDCDGEIDENTGTTWYEDADDDGWGDAAVWAYTQPEGTAADAGLADVLVGAPGDWSEGVFEGAAYLVLGGVSGVVDLAAADAVTTGDARSDGFGASLASGDHDGDGRPDVAFGAPGTGSYGGASLLHGPPTW